MLSVCTFITVYLFGVKSLTDILQFDHGLCIPVFRELIVVKQRRETVTIRYLASQSFEDLPVNTECGIGISC